jgi:hypothetical protein
MTVWQELWVKGRPSQNHLRTSRGPHQHPGCPLGCGGCRSIKIEEGRRPPLLTAPKAQAPPTFVDNTFFFTDNECDQDADNHREP